MTKRIRILIADDHTLVRRGLRALLATRPELEVVGEVCDGEAAVAQARALRPDVVLMDIGMPGLDGIEATRQVKAACPATNVLILTSFTTDDKVFPALRAGAQGYLLKDSEPEELVEAIRSVAGGSSSLHPDIAHMLLHELAHPAPRPQPPDHRLTERELDVLRLLAHGLKNRAIADALCVSDTTVRGHVSSMLGKLGLESRTALALHAVREGLVELNEEDKA